MASETQPTPTEEEFIAVIETGPLTEVEVRDAPDGSGLIITAVAVDPDTSDEVPVSITLDPGGDAFVVTIAEEEVAVQRDQASQGKTSSQDSGRIRALQKLHELATRLEHEAKGKARALAERLRRKRGA